MPLPTALSASHIVQRLCDAVAHQVLNPLAAATLELQALEDAGLAPEAAESIRRTQEALLRAGAFVQGLSAVTSPDLSRRPAALMARIEALFAWKPPVALQTQAPSATTRPRIDPSTATVLYIEDESDVADLMIETMQDWGFTNIRWVDNAEAALAVFDEGGPVDLVVSDYLIPGNLDGLEVARRARGKRPGLPFIFVTGTEDAIRRRLTPEEGIEFHIFSKPIDLKGLSEAMTAALQRSV